MYNSTNQSADVTDVTLVQLIAGHRLEHDPLWGTTLDSAFCFWLRIEVNAEQGIFLSLLFSLMGTCSSSSDTYRYIASHHSRFVFTPVGKVLAVKAYCTPPGDVLQKDIENTMAAERDLIAGLLFLGKACHGCCNNTESDV